MGALLLLSSAYSPEPRARGRIAYSKAYHIAYKAWYTAYKQKYTYSSIYAYIDFSLPSTVPRFFVVQNGQVIYSTYVTHGIGSGNGNYADSFSNIPGSHASSIGVYRTGEYYYGKNGKSQKLYGLEKGWNNNAYERLIVIHGASYIRAGMSFPGHSWGCFAVPSKNIQDILKLLPPGTIITAYANNPLWLKTSLFLMS